MVTARQQQADDTRRRLFASAVALFSRDGYHATRVDEICARARVAKGTFFIHYATKDAIVVELVHNQTLAALGARAEAAAKGPVAALRATVLELGRHAGGSRELSRAVLAATLANPQVAHAGDELFGPVIAAMIDDARHAPLRRGVDPELLARALVAGYLGAAFHFASNPDSAALAELLAPIVDALLEGNLRHAKNAQPRARRRRVR
jgi:AcrR family transcriptional regulator